MASIINLLRKIFRLKGRANAQPEVSRHFLNLRQGPHIYINGKPYVKVKLRFVDSIHFETSRYLDQLETLVESQRGEIEALDKARVDHEQKIDALQMLNINLMNETRIKINRLNASNNEIVQNLQDRNKTITQIEKDCEELNSLNISLNEQIKALIIKVKSKDNRIGQLEQEIQWVRTTKKTDNLSKKEITRLKRHPDRSIYKVYLKNKEIEDKDKTISILSQKELEYLRKLSELENKLKSFTDSI